MLKFVSQIVGLPVVPQDLPEPAGTIARPVVDPATGKVGAYELRSRQSRRFVSVIDIISYFEDGVVIRDNDAIQQPDDLVRLKPLLSEPFTPSGVRVVTESGRRLGKVADYSIDTGSHLIAKLHIRPPFWIWREELIIPREHVTKMSRREIVVRYDGTVPTNGTVPAETAH